MKDQIERVRRQHQRDFDAGFGAVHLLFALDRKYPNESRKFGWQWVFPALRISRDRRTGRQGRHHVGEDFFADAFKQELREWVFGSEDFLLRMVVLAEGSDRDRHASTSRRLHSVSVKEVVEGTASQHGIAPSAYAVFRSQAAGRDTGGKVSQGKRFVNKNFGDTDVDYDYDYD